MQEIRPRNWDETVRIMAEARREQSRHLIAGVLWVGRALMTLVRGAGTVIAEAQRSHTVYHTLSRMTDRELRDIGLNRGDIAAVAAGVWTREVELDTAKVVIVANANQAAASTPAPAELRKAA